MLCQLEENGQVLYIQRDHCVSPQSKPGHCLKFNFSIMYADSMELIIAALIFITFSCRISNGTNTILCLAIS